MRRLVLVIALVFGALVTDAPAQQQEQRIGLIIANADYAEGSTLGRLNGVHRDAAAIRPALENVGFDVAVRTNLPRQPMLDAVREFAGRIRAAGPEAVGFFYYSGHGVADEARTDNFLVPVDARITALAQLQTDAVSLREVIEIIAEAGAGRVVIVIDACRNTPDSLTRGTERGLVAVGASVDMLVAYSTLSGRTAADNGLYAAALAQEITRPGSSTSNVFQDVGSVVSLQTNRTQIPTFQSALVEPIVFRAGRRAELPPRNGRTIIVQPPPPPPPNPACVTGRPPGNDLACFKECDECPEMVILPPGPQFVMGSPESEQDRQRVEGPQLRVSVPRFAIGRYPLTRQEYAHFVLETNRRQPSTCNTARGQVGWWRDPGFPQTDRDPVVCVSWNDAQDYARWLSARTGATYRLPSEAEWEYAARATVDARFHWGNVARHDFANYGPEGAGVAGNDRWLFTSPVGSFPPNLFGLFDMNGNVYQWAQDCWSESLLNTPRNAQPYSPSGCNTRTIRGGNWASPEQDIRAAYRNRTDAFINANTHGFRIARTIN